MEYDLIVGVILDWDVDTRLMPAFYVLTARGLLLGVKIKASCVLDLSSLRSKNGCFSSGEPNPILVSDMVAVVGQERAIGITENSHLALVRLDFDSLPTWEVTFMCLDGPGFRLVASELALGVFALRSCHRSITFLFGSLAQFLL